MVKPIEQDLDMRPRYCAILLHTEALHGLIMERLKNYQDSHDARISVGLLLDERLRSLAQMSYMRGYMDGMKEIAEGLS